MIEKILQNIGLSDKEIKIYLSCLSSGPSSVRRIAEKSGINRGTVYDILKSLQELGLVSYYHKDKHQYFIAEDPAKLQDVLEQKKKQLEKNKKEIDSIIPELKSIYNTTGQKPVVKYYEGVSGIRAVLKDVLTSCKQGSKKYYVYSSSTIKQYLYAAYKSFSTDRITAGIEVQTISIGPGGETRGLDERKWLTKKVSTPTYILIYDNKLAMISVDSANKPIGVIIEDKNIYQTQKIIFEFIWEKI